MKIVIIGAGFGGMASAIWLARAGHDVEIFEQSPELRASGNGVLLFPNGTGLLRELGVDLDGLGVRMESVRGIHHSGKRVMNVKLSEIARRFDAPALVAARGRVVERMSELLPEGCLRLGVRCTGLEEIDGDSAPRVAVSFADGTQVKADLVIGADGQRSMVRGHLFGADPASYLGDATWHGITELPGEFADGNDIHSVFGDEGICVMHPVGEGKVYWAFELPWHDGDVLPPGALSQQGKENLGADATGTAVGNLRARFGHWTAPVLRDLLESLRESDVSVFPHIIHRQLTSWGKGAITLVGDAAHAVPPRVGMGLSQALEDAWVLSRALSGDVDPVEQLRGYERVRIQRVQSMQRAARALGRKTVPMPPWLLLRIGRFLPVTRFNLNQVKSTSNFLNNDLPAKAG